VGPPSTESAQDEILNPKYKLKEGLDSINKYAKKKKNQQTNSKQKCLNRYFYFKSRIFLKIKNS
jgi:hypothetical protein